MVALGLVLLVLAALLTLGIVLSNTDPANAAAFGVTLSHVSIGGLFLVGVVTGAVAMLGLTLLLGGSVRQRNKRVAAKRQVRSATGEASSLQEENARLAAELEETRRRSGPAPVVEEEPRRGMFGR
jgi:TRAP-type C4-dicarboxylate transport system permease large subunit